MYMACLAKKQMSMQNTGEVQMQSSCRPLVPPCTIYCSIWQWHSCLLNFAWRACSAFAHSVGRNWVTINGTIVEVTQSSSSSQGSDGGDKLDGKEEIRVEFFFAHCFLVRKIAPWQPAALTHTYRPKDKVPLVPSLKRAFILCLQNNKGVLCRFCAD